MSELLPCPFCPPGKSDPKLLNPAEYMHYVKCCSCGCMSGLVCSSEEQAVENWNTRAAVTDEQFAFAVHDGDALQNVRTCHNTDSVPGDGSGFYPTPHFKCSECGASYALTDYAYYCPRCGRKVVEP